MLTIRAAARLLADTASPDTAAPLAHALGFIAHLVRLTRRECRGLGLDGLVDTARLVEGIGARRLLIANLPVASDLPSDFRRSVAAVAKQIARAAPTHYWTLLILDGSGRHLCLATVTDTPQGVQIAAAVMDRQQLRDADADTVRSFASVEEPDDMLHHARCTDILRRDAVSQRFFETLRRAVDALAMSLHVAPRASAPRGCTTHDTEPTPAERRELALVMTSRCLFLAFLEAKGWLDHRRDFLMYQASRTMTHGGRLHHRLLRPLFFGTLNTPRRDRAATARAFGAIPFLNGGLFAPTALERRWHRYQFRDDAILDFLRHVLDRYRFTAQEDSNAWSEAAVDPEMLGRAFEGLMAPAERRRSGSFYTPPHLVDHIVRDALSAHCSALAPLLTTLDQPLVPDPRWQPWHATLSRLRILDPACGSGACLVRMLDLLDQLLIRAGDQRDATTRRRAILTTSIFGVDREPLAVWLCELRLWLAMVIDSPTDDIARIAPLPNLDHHIRLGDALAGGTFQFAPPSARTLTRLRERYTRANGPRKRALAVSLNREERHRATVALEQQITTLRHARRELVHTMRSADLFGTRHRPPRQAHQTLRQLRERTRELLTQQRRLQRGGALPFRFVTMFADVAATGGFDLIIGNPPWIRPHAVPANERVRLREEFVSMRNAPWRAGALRAGAGAGFATQADVAAAFVERSTQLLAPNGTLALLVPAKLWRGLSGGGLRELLTTRTRVHRVRDWSDAPPQFDAATYPSLLVAGRVAASATAPSPCAVDITRRRHHAFHITHDTLPLDASPGAPWLLLPKRARTAFDLLQQAGTALAESPLGRPKLGVKCGCNAAFLVHAMEHADDTATVSTVEGPEIRQGVIERHLLRPALRGEQLTSTIHPPSPAHDLRIIWTHGTDGAPRRALPPATAHWLAHWRPTLERRRDALRARHWWTLFRTEAARSDTARVVWSDIGRRLTPRVLDAGDPTIPLNSCYVVHAPSSDEAYALAALMRSRLLTAWLDPLAEPARGGFRRYMGWTMAMLPIPRDWSRAVHQLAPLGRAYATHTTPAPTLSATLEDTVLAVYALAPSTIRPLLTWYDAD